MVTLQSLGMDQLFFFFGRYNKLINKTTQTFIQIVDLGKEILNIIREIHTILVQ